MILALLHVNKQEATRSNEASKIQLGWGGCRNPPLNKVGVGSSSFPAPSERNMAVLTRVCRKSQILV